MARIEAGPRHCSSVPTTCGHSAQECADTIVDDLERDLTESQAQHAMPSVRVVPSTAVANRFSSLATESDDEQVLRTPSRQPCRPAIMQCVRVVERGPHG